MGSSLSSVHGMGSLLSGAATFTKSQQGRPDDDLNEYIRCIWLNLVAFPSYDVEESFDVYILSSGPLSHSFLLFLLPDLVEGFAIHMQVNQEERAEFKLETYNVRVLRNQYQNLKAVSLGKTRPFTAAHIITEAKNTLGEMELYNQSCNNSTDYCNRVAKDIGLNANSTDILTMNQLHEKYDKPY